MNHDPSFSSEHIVPSEHGNSFRHLNPDEWKDLYSPYIDGGYKDDSFEITHLAFNEREVMATCRMTRFYISSTDDAGFHLSVFTAIAILGQPSIIHAHAINGIWRKDHEVLMSKLDIELNRPIRTPDEITLRMWITEQRSKPSASQKGLVRAAYTWAFDIEQGAFTGHLKAHFTFRNDEGSFFGESGNSRLGEQYA